MVVLGDDFRLGCQRLTRPMTSIDRNWIREPRRGLAGSVATNGELPAQSSSAQASRHASYAVFSCMRPRFRTRSATARRVGPPLSRAIARTASKTSKRRRIKSELSASSAVPPRRESRSVGTACNRGQRRGPSTSQGAPHLPRSLQDVRRAAALRPSARHLVLARPCPRIAGGRWSTRTTRSTLRQRRCRLPRRPLGDKPAPAQHPADPTVRNLGDGTPRRGFDLPGVHRPGSRGRPACPHGAEPGR